MLLLKKINLVLSALLLGASAINAQIYMTFTGSSTNTLAGFDAGVTTSFSFELSDQATSRGQWESYKNIWKSEKLEQNFLVDIDGANFEGDYAYIDSGLSSTVVQFQDDYFTFQTEDISGLTSGGSNVTQFEFSGIDIYFSGFGVDDGDDPGLVNWVTANVGVYNLDSGGESLGSIVTEAGTVDFSVDSITLSTSAVPEPSTYALFAGIIALAVVARKRKLRK